MHAVSCLCITLNRHGSHTQFAEGLVNSYREVGGGGKKWEGGGHVKFYPLEKGGGGRQKTVLVILKGGAKSFHSLKGGALKVFDPRFSHFVAPLPVINDQSLSRPYIYAHVMVKQNIYQMCVYIYMYIYIYIYIYIYTCIYIHVYIYIYIYIYIYT